MIGNSSNIEVGDTVIAIGNPFGLSDTMTTGIVSGIGRSLAENAGIPINLKGAYVDTLMKNGPADKEVL